MSITALQVISCAALVASVIVAARNRNYPLAIFHPLLAPGVYLAIVLAAPILYISSGGAEVSILTVRILHSTTVAVAVLGIAGYYLGAAVGMVGARIANTPELGVTEVDRLQGPWLSQWGRWLLFATIAANIANYGITRGQAYGAGQTAYGLSPMLSVVSGALTGPAIVIMCIGAVLQGKRKLTALELFAIATAFLCAGGLMSSRAELLAGFIALAWFWLLQHPEVSMARVLALGSAAIFTVLTAFSYLAHVRSPSGSGKDIGWQLSTLVDLSSPTYLTTLVAERVPQHVSYLNGSTYVAALSAWMPGPIAHTLGRIGGGTGALYFRALTGYSNPDQGWGFAYTTEAYLNFGIVGVIAAAILLGWLMARIYRRAMAAPRSTKLSAFVYPVILGYFPYGLRSDALGQLKSIIYPLIGYLIISQCIRMRDTVVHDGMTNKPRNVGAESRVKQNGA